ncbi:MAG: efflux RND transporter permease subunit, partial [candidate division Zixibacteria bacterium]|nr:efflux RND transporter permease subunit [candidate division Zixibacteria bacterium]
MRQFEQRFGEWVVRNRWWVIAATVLLFLAAFYGTGRLTISSDTRVFFSEDNPQLQALDALENTYTRSNTVFFTVAPKDGDVFTAHTLAAVEALTEASWRIPYSSRVNSITNFQHTKVDGDELVVQDLVSNSATVSALELKAIRRVALDEPELVNNLVSVRGHVTGVSVNLILPGESPTEVIEVAAFVRAMADEIRSQHSGIDFYLTGSVMSDNAFGEASMKDMSTLLPLMFLVLALVAGLALRSVTGTVNTLIIIMMSMATGMGLAGWFGLEINAASSNAPTIIMGLAVADSIHILTTIVQQMRRGRSKSEAVAESLRINLLPVFLTSVTTAIGFLTMNFSDAPPFRDLGNIVAMGVMGALVYSVLFLPALTAVLPMRVKTKSTEYGRSMLDKVADLVIDKRRVVFFSMITVSMVLALGVTRIDLQDDWMKYFDKSYDIRIATDFTEENLTGFNSIEYDLESHETGGISNPEYLAKADEFSQWLMRQPKVSHVSSITNTMKRLNRTMHAD